jgi:RES domain
MSASSAFGAMQIEITAPLSFVDLRGDGAIRMGVSSDVARASSQRLGRAWSLAFHQHTSAPDGIVYPSRSNGQTNLAVYDRATSKLRVANVGVRSLRRRISRRF